MNELEKMDALKERLNVTYAQAKEALDAHDGDLAQALVDLEEKGATQAGRDEECWGEAVKDSKWDKETTENFVRGLVDQAKGFVREGNVTKIRLKQGERVLVEIPATVGVVGIGVMLFSPLFLAISAIGAATAMAKEMLFEIERPDGTVEQHSLKLPALGKKDKCGGKEAAGDEAAAEQCRTTEDVEDNQ